MNRELLEITMSKEGMEKGLRHDSYGLKDPGTALIVSISIIVLLLLFAAGLESAGADPGAVEEKVVDGGTTRQGTERLPVLGPGLDGRNEMEFQHPGAEKEEVRKKVHATALEHHPVSESTDLVAVQQQEVRPSGRVPATIHLKTDPPQSQPYEKIFGGAAKTLSPSEMLMVLGFLLLLIALILSRDRKEG